LRILYTTTPGKRESKEARRDGSCLPGSIPQNPAQHDKDIPASSKTYLFQLKTVIRRNNGDIDGEGRGYQKTGNCFEKYPFMVK